MGCPESLCSSASSQDLLKKSPNALGWPRVVQELELDARRLGPPAFLSLLRLCALPTFQSTRCESLFSNPYLPLSQVSVLLHCETLKEHRKILYFTLSVLVKKYSFSKSLLAPQAKNLKFVSIWQPLQLLNLPITPSEIRVGNSPWSFLVWMYYFCFNLIPFYLFHFILAMWNLNFSWKPSLY